jgi:hypothetical protein
MLLSLPALSHTRMLIPVSHIHSYLIPKYRCLQELVFDLINVAEIHNKTITSSDVLTNDTFFQIRTLADSHEFGLAYNASDDTRAMVGMQLAAEILQYMNSTITSKGASKLGIQFGAYATFLSFFGLSNLTAASPDFYGVPGYASAMVFELFTNGTASTTFPDASDLQVRFLFSNGTSSSGTSTSTNTNASAPVAFPLFGGSATSIPWSTFAEKMDSFAVGTTEEWCTKCGNTTGTCAPFAPSNSSSSSSSSSGSSSSHHGISAAVGGVIGAMVTLAVLLGLGALVMLVGGMRLVSKKRLAGPSPAGSTVKA